MAYLENQPVKVMLVYCIHPSKMYKGVEESLYYSKIIYEEASINCLRKRHLHNK